MSNYSKETYNKIGIDFLARKVKLVGQELKLDSEEILSMLFSNSITQDITIINISTTNSKPKQDFKIKFLKFCLRLLDNT